MIAGSSTAGQRPFHDHPRHDRRPVLTRVYLSYAQTSVALIYMSPSLSNNRQLLNFGKQEASLPRRAQRVRRA